MNWRKLLLGRRAEERALLPRDVPGLEEPETWSGIANVDDATALKFSTVYASATLIADAVAGLPPKAHRLDAQGNWVDVELPAWVRKPHVDMRRFDVWHQLLLSLLLWGNAFAAILRRPSDAAIVGLLPLDPSAVTCEFDPKRPGLRRYRVAGGPWQTTADIFHVQGPTLPGQPKGMSVIAQAREAIALGLTLDEFAARYFSQGSQAKIVIELPGQVPNEEKAKAIVRTFERFHRGRDNWHRPALATGGAKLHNISIPPDEAQFLQSREFQAYQVASWFRVPPHRVGLVTKSTSWGSGLAEENLAFVQHSVRPWILRMEDALSAHAAGGEASGVQIRLDESELLRGTFSSTADVYGDLYVRGLISLNEARRAVGLPSVEGGDRLPGSNEQGESAGAVL